MTPSTSTKFGFSESSSNLEILHPAKLLPSIELRFLGSLMLVIDEPPANANESICSTLCGMLSSTRFGQSMTPLRIFTPFGIMSVFNMSERENPASYSPLANIEDMPWGRIKDSNCVWYPKYVNSP